jgi:hypothetical protein
MADDHLHTAFTFGRKVSRDEIERGDFKQQF